MHFHMGLIKDTRVLTGRGLFHNDGYVGLLELGLEKCSRAIYISIILFGYNSDEGGRDDYEEISIV